MSKFKDFIFNNAHQADAAEAERGLREKYPHLLHAKEQILLAWKDRGGMGRDKSYFTSHRILIKDGKGASGKRKNYKSIPYFSIEAFAISTAGSLDGDTSVRIYSKGIELTEIEFAKSSVNIYDVKRFLNAKVLAVSRHGSQEIIQATPPKPDASQSVMDWFGDNAQQIDKDVIAIKLKEELPVLLPEEQVQIAFKSGRDYTVFTDMRILIVDVKGVSGKRIGFFSVLWHSIHAYSVETAGRLDRDTEFCLYTNIHGVGRIEQDLRNGKADLFTLQKVLCNHILGEDTEPMTGLDTHEGEVDQKGFWWFRDNQRPLDVVEMNQVYHSSPSILRGNETIEMAFKGHRDITLFTNLRVIMIDPKGLSGKKIEYTSLPWTSITGHAVRTAGKYLDMDSEVCFWTEMDFYPGRAGSGEDNPPEPPRPEQSYFEIDFNKKKVDMMALNYYLSHRLVTSREKMERGAPIPIETLKNQGGGFDAPGMGFEAILQKVGGDQREIDAKALDEDLHANTQLLLEDEHVLMAFKAGRDTSIFTNQRVILLDVQGLTGHKVEYRSLPFKSIRSWSCETAGTWDTDTELTLYTRNRWDMCEINMDFRTGKADIAQINRFFSALIIGLPSDSRGDFTDKNYHSGSSQESNPISGGSMHSSRYEIDAGEIDKKLRSDPALLLDEEKVLHAFQRGRDIDAYTNRRLIFIDAKGMSGKRVNYRSIPYHQIQGYEFETAGAMIDKDAEIYLHTQISDLKREEFPRVVPTLTTKQSLKKKTTDIYEIGNFFNEHVLFVDEGYADEPEVSMNDASIYN